MLSWVEHEKSFIILGPGYKNIREVTQEMPQSQSTAHPKHQKGWMTTK